MSIDLSTIFQVMPYAQNVAHAEVTHPAAQQATATELAKQHLKEEEQQVQKLEEQDAADAIKDQGGERRQEGRHPGKRQAREHPTDEHTNPAHISAWTGNLIDAKI
jgi:DNA-binding protein H-NS